MIGLFEFMCANSELLSTSDICYMLHANQKVLKEFKLRQVNGLWSCCQQPTCRFSEVWNRLNSSSGKSITDVKFSANCRPFNVVKSSMAWDTVSPKNVKKNIVQVHSYMPVLVSRMAITPKCDCPNPTLDCADCTTVYTNGDTLKRFMRTRQACIEHIQSQSELTTEDFLVLSSYCMVPSSGKVQPQQFREQISQETYVYNHVFNENFTGVINNLMLCYFGFYKGFDIAPSEMLKKILFYCMRCQYIRSNKFKTRQHLVAKDTTTVDTMLSNLFILNSKSSILREKVRQQYMHYTVNSDEYTYEVAEILSDTFKSTNSRLSDNVYFCSIFHKFKKCTDQTYRHILLNCAPSRDKLKHNRCITYMELSKDGTEETLYTVTPELFNYRNASTAMSYYLKLADFFKLTTRLKRKMGVSFGKKDKNKVYVEPTFDNLTEAELFWLRQPHSVKSCDNLRTLKDTHAVTIFPADLVESSEPMEQDDEDDTDLLAKILSGLSELEQMQVATQPAPPPEIFEVQQLTNSDITEKYDMIRQSVIKALQLRQ